jgi:hypothetical protein
MCECGCTMRDEKYTLPAPMGAIYVITVSGACVDCDAPIGMCVERIDPGRILYKEYLRGDFTSGRLKLEDWSDSKGAAFIAGMRKHEFVKAISKHLVGVSSAEMGEDGKIDEIGAEVIAEEMYDDAQIHPHLVRPAPSPQ